MWALVNYSSDEEMKLDCEYPRMLAMHAIEMNLLGLKLRFYLFT